MGLSTGLSYYEYRRDWEYYGKGNPILQCKRRSLCWKTHSILWRHAPHGDLYSRVRDVTKSQCVTFNTNYNELRLAQLNGINFPTADFNDESHYVDPRYKQPRYKEKPWLKVNNFFVLWPHKVIGKPCHKNIALPMDLSWRVRLKLKRKKKKCILD